MPLPVFDIAPKTAKHRKVKVKKEPVAYMQTTAPNELSSPVELNSSGN